METDLKKISEAKLRNDVIRYSRENFTKVVSVQEAADIINKPLYVLYYALANKELRYSGPGQVRLIEVLGWLEKDRTNIVSLDSPLWLRDLLFEGHGCIRDIFCPEAIQKLSKIADDLYEENKEKPESTLGSFDELANGEFVLERLRCMWNTPMSWILGHPIFDEVADKVFNTTQWIPFLFLALYKNQYSLPTVSHRDIPWFTPEKYGYVRFLCQIQLTPPSAGDGGLRYLPKSHMIKNDLTMIPQGTMGGPSTEGFLPFKSTNLCDMNLHNLGVLHSVAANDTPVQMKRLYIGIIPLDDPALCKFFPTRSVQEEMLEFITNAKREYATATAPTIISR